MISFSINIVLNLILMNFLKHAGLALSSAISALITFILLFNNLSIHSIQIPFENLKNNLLKFIFPLTGLLSSLAIFELFFYENIIVYCLESNISYANASRIYLVVSISIATGLYFIVSFKMKIEEFEIIFGRIFKKFIK